MMKKKWFLIFHRRCAAHVLFFFARRTSLYQLTLNGKNIVFDVEPRQRKRAAALYRCGLSPKVFGAKVDWNNTPPTVVISRGNNAITLQPGLKKALKNNKEFNLETAPQMVNGRILVPVRFVSEALGAQVNWQPYTRSVAINDPHSGTATSREPLENLPVVGSLSNLKKLLEEAEPFYAYGYLRRGAWDLETSAAAEDGQAAAMKEAAPTVPDASGNYSQTNIQVQGVDEADIVKTDGTYIYQVNRGRVIIARAYPPGQMEICSTIDFKDENFTPCEIYVDEKHLAVIGTSSKEIPATVKPVLDSDTRMKIYPPPFYFANTVKTIIFDIADRKNCKHCGKSNWQGYYVSFTQDRFLPLPGANRQIDYYYIMRRGAENPAPSFRDTATIVNLQASTWSISVISADFTRPIIFSSPVWILPGQTRQVEVHTFLGAGDNIYAFFGNTFT